MVLKEVMDEMGSTNKRLREIFTTAPTEPNKPLKGEPEDWRKVNKKDRPALRAMWKKRRDKLQRDYNTRIFFEEQIERHVEEGVLANIRNHRIYTAVDMAMDSTPINDFTIPLNMYAQGKIKLDQCVQQLRSCGCDESVFVHRQGNPNAEVVAIDIPRFVDFSMNVVKSTVRRRVAAQTNKYSNLWPFLKVEPRGSDQVSRVRSDALSTLMDIISDDYGTREHTEQVIRYGLMYGRCMDFKVSDWMYEAHPRFMGESRKIETRVTKQGFRLYNPHPSRWAADPAFPPSSINTDTGCNWLFFWDAVRYREILTESRYFNTQHISISSRIWDLYNSERAFFENQNLGRLVIPGAYSMIDQSTTSRNDRTLRFGLYSQDQEDAAVFKIEYYCKIVPSKHGIGDYSGPVWVRLTATSDGTVINAEFLYSRPACHLGIDEDDNRMISTSMAMELLHFQDAMTNLVTQMLLLMQLETLTIVGMNVDAFPQSEEGKAMANEIRRRLQGKNFSGEPYVIEYSMEKLRSLFGDDASARSAIIDIKQAQTSTSIQVVFNAITQLLGLMDRMLTMSPSETGQPAPREISATEVVAINNSTSTVYDAISNNIDTYRGALKRMFYESAVNCWKGKFVLPLTGRYPDEAIRNAGFTIEATDDIVVKGRSRVTVSGLPSTLLPEYSYAFTSRDGAERPSDVKAAQAMAQTLQFILQVPQVVQSLGKEKLFEIINEIFRMAGATVPLNLQVEPGDDNQFQDSQIAAIAEMIEQLKQALIQTGEIIEEISGKVDDQERINNEQQELLSVVNDLANQMKGIQGQQQSLEERTRVDTPKIAYDKAPPSVQSQIEMRHGFEPAGAAERVFNKGDKLPEPQ